MSDLTPHPTPVSFSDGYGRGLIESSSRILKSAIETFNPTHIVSMVCGSELFMRVGEEFFADPVYCGAEIERLYQENHKLRLRAIKAEKALRDLQPGAAAA